MCFFGGGSPDPPPPPPPLPPDPVEQRRLRREREEERQRKLRAQGLSRTILNDEPEEPLAGGGPRPGRAPSKTLLGS